MQLRLGLASDSINLLCYTQLSLSLFSYALLRSTRLCPALQAIVLKFI